MFPIALVTRLEEKGVGSLEEDLFVNNMPAEKTVGVMALTPLSGVEYDHELPGYRQGRFEVVVRTPNGLSDRTLVNQVLSALTFHREQAGDYWVIYCRPVHEPVPFPVSNGDLTEWSVRFDACYLAEGDSLPV